MNRDQLYIFLAVLVGLLIFILAYQPFSPNTQNKMIVSQEEEDIPEMAEILESVEAPPLSREEEAARKSLRDLPLQEGSVGDKMLNFLLSGKRDYYRELYELKNNQFTADHLPGKDMKAELDHLAAILLAYSNLKIEVISHTQSKENWEKEQEITATRSEGIQKYLIESGLDNVRVSASGYGASRPIADNSSERGRQLNDRTEIIIRGL